MMNKYDKIFVEYDIDLRATISWEQIIMVVILQLNYHKFWK